MFRFFISSGSPNGTRHLDPWRRYVDRTWERGGYTSTRGQVEDSLLKLKQSIVNAAFEDLHGYEGDIKSLLFYQVTSLQKVQAGERESELWEGFADKYHNVQWGGFGGIPDFVKVDASEIAQEARRLYRANIYQFVDQVESQMSVNRREMKRLAEPNFAGTGVAVYSDYVSSLEPEVNRRIARTIRMNEAVIAMGNDPRAVNIVIARGETVNSDRFYVATNNLITMGNASYALVQGNTYTTDKDSKPNTVAYVSEEIAMLGDWTALLDGQLVSIVHDMGIIEDSLEETHEINMMAGDSYKLQFTITRDSMVNLWVNQSDITTDRIHERFNIDLELRAMIGGSFVSDNNGDAGESISHALPAGKYTLTLTDNTDYSGETLMSAEEVEQLILNVGVGINIKPYTTQKIEGRISIPESGKTMEVSMSVATFDDIGNRNKNYELSPSEGGVDQLNPNKPVWVVVHGRKDSENGNNIDFLAQSLFSRGYQVVTLNWEDSAKDNGVLVGALNGANWIPSVGKWAADQLKAMGFKGDKVLDGGHSWGSLVAYEIGKNYKYGQDGNGYGIQAIVAMDSPTDPLPNNYPIHDVVFNDVSKVSWAFLSSSFGSGLRANTANYNFDILGVHENEESTIFMTPEKKLLLDNAQAYLSEHGYSVSYFANLVNGEGDTSLDILDIDKLVNGEMLGMVIDPDGPEGILPITVEESKGTNGEYWQAVPTTLQNTP